MAGKIKKADLANLTRSLVRFPSVNPPGEEKAVADFIHSWFVRNGFEVEMKEAVSGRPNVVARLAGEGDRILLFNGHMDVVPAGTGWRRNPFAGEVVGDRLYGRGSADMKGALASMMLAMRALRTMNEKLPGTVVFTAVVDEEMGGPHGTAHLVREGLRGDFAIVGEPTNMHVCVAHKGTVAFELTTHGKSAHASMPEEGVNAIEKMMKLIQRLDSYSEGLRRKPPHPLLGRGSLSVGTIHGGIKSNIIPDTCAATVDRRLVPPDDTEDIRDEIADMLAEARASDPDLRYSLRYISSVGTSQMKGGHRGLNALLSSVREVTGRPAAPMGFVATCDAYHLNTAGSTPTAIFGPGRLADIHKPDEYVTVRQLAVAAEVYALTALKVLLT